MANGCITENVQGFHKLLLCKFKITVRFPFRLRFIFIKASVFVKFVKKACSAHPMVVVKVIFFLQKEGLVDIYTSWTFCNETSHR